MTPKKKSFEFATKQARNAFLRRNNLCIAGSLHSWPNVLDGNGELVGDAFQRDGKHQVEIWEQFIHCVAERGAMDAAND